MFARFLTRKRQSVKPSTAPVLDRKIHPNVDSLLETANVIRVDDKRVFSAPKGVVEIEGPEEVPRVLTTRLSQIADPAGIWPSEVESASSATGSIPSQSSHPSTRSSRGTRRDSPGTFGYPTPPSNQRRDSAPFSPPHPPMPPLSHPEINGQPRVLRTSSSLPGQATTNRARSIVSQRSSKKSIQRRTSADWSSLQAISPCESESWQAQVSMEILRLSFPGISGAAHVVDPPASLSHRGSPPTTSLGSPFLFQASEVDDKLSRYHGDTTHSHFETKPAMEMKNVFTPATPTRNTRRLQPVASSSGQPHSMLQPPALAYTSPTPDTSPGRYKRSTSELSRSVLKVPQNDNMGTPTSRGKRKAEDVDGTPPDVKKGQRTSFAPDPDRRSHHRVSAVSNASSRAPTSYHRKRAKTSGPSLPETPTRPSSRLTSGNAGSWSSRTSSTRPGLPQVPPRAVSRATSVRSRPESSMGPPTKQHRGPRRSISAASIPLSALISPHAPSIARSATFHMRDPRKPPKKKSTGWSLRFGSEDEAGSPVQAWCFFIGFFLFPIWWIAGWVLKVPETRRVGTGANGTLGTVDEEKATVVIDDPQVEFDAKSWRWRCRLMGFISLVTYVPFIVLVAVFAS